MADFIYRISGLSTTRKDTSTVLTVHMQKIATGKTFNLTFPITVSTSKETILNAISIIMGCSLDSITISQVVDFSQVGILL
jgi:hypothetical protein